MPVSFPVQLGGLIGERKGISDGVVEAVARRSSSTMRPASWHTDRTPVLDIVTHALRYAQWAEKVAGDIAHPRRAFGEVKHARAEDRAQPPASRTRSTRCGRWRPPESCGGVASIILLAASPTSSNDGLGSWHAEWFALPLVFMTAGAAMEAIRDSLSSLEVVS